MSGELHGNELQCRECNKLTRCNEDNMYFNPHDGSIHTGEETIPGFSGASFDEIRPRLDEAHRRTKRSRPYKEKVQQRKDEFYNWPEDTRRRVAEWVNDRHHRSDEDLKEWVKSGGDPTQ